MGTLICHLDGMFFEWTTMSDAPVTYGLSREEFEAYYRDEYGRSGMEGLPRRIERAIQFGTSCYLGTTFDDLVRTNHAGPKGKRLSRDELIAFLKNRADDDAPAHNS